MNKASTARIEGNIRIVDSPLETSSVDAPQPARSRRPRTWPKDTDPLRDELLRRKSDFSPTKAYSSSSLATTVTSGPSSPSRDALLSTGGGALLGRAYFRKPSLSIATQKAFAAFELIMRGEDPDLQAFVDNMTDDEVRAILSHAGYTLVEKALRSGLHSNTQAIQSQQANHDTELLLIRLVLQRAPSWPKKRRVVVSETLIALVTAEERRHRAHAVVAKRSAKFAQISLSRSAESSDSADEGDDDESDSDSDDADSDTDSNIDSGSDIAPQAHLPS